MYERLLGRAPLATNVMLTTILWGTGDILAQRLAGDYDAKRALVTAGYAGAVIGSTGHVWYQFIDKTARRTRLLPGSTAFIAAKIAADVLVFDSVHLGAFFAFMTWNETRSISQVKEKLEKDFAAAYIVDASFWSCFQALNFKYVPVRHQLQAVNLASVLESTFLCWARAEEDWVDSLAAKLPSISTSSSSPVTSDDALSVQRAESVSARI